MPNTSRSFAVVVVACIMLAIVGAWWGGWFLPEPVVAPAAPERPATAASVSATVGTDGEVGAAEATNDSARTAASSGQSAADGTGALLLHVRRGSPPLPVADIPVRLWRPGADNLFDALRATTDAAGDVQFPKLAPGNVYLEPGRGYDADFLKVAIVAGQTTEATLSLKPGMDVRGRVVDAAGNGIDDAEVVHAGWGGGATAVLTHSAADGTFALRGIETHCHIGARKPGLRPSAMRQFTAGEGASVECVLVLDGDGASLGGLVLGPDGVPVAEAVVTAGSSEQNLHRLPDGGQGMAPQPVQVRTDARGRFHIPSLVPGKLPLLVRARALAPWREEVEVVVGRAEERTIHLQPGVVVHGVVRDAAGAAVAKAEVVVELERELGWRSTVAGPHGAYRIEGLPAGSLPMRAERDKVGKVKSTLEASVGQVVRWDPVLSLGLQLQGRIVDGDGKPVRDVIVEAQDERPRRGESFWVFETSDADGRFVIDNCVAGRPLRISFRKVSTFPELLLRDVLPGPEPLLVTLAPKGWVHIHGKVCGPDGELLTNVQVSPYMKDSYSGSPAEALDAKTGEFRFGPYPPGTFGIRIETDGFPEIHVGERACAPGETWELGELRFERGGRLVVHPITAGELPKLTLRLERADGRWLQNLQADGSVFQSGPVVTGTHLLTASGPGIATTRVPCEVRVGVETRLDLPLESGHDVEFEVVTPAESTAVRVLDLVVRRNGDELWRGRIGAREGRHTLKLALATGAYEVEAMADGWRGVASFRVAGQPLAVPITLAAK
jgi:hypothetical protein